MRTVAEVPGCRGCPMYGDGSQGFVPDELIENARVLVQGQNPGEEEEAQGRPFVGKTGQAMEKRYFKVAGLERGQVSIANALRCRWQDSNELPALVQPKWALRGKRGQAEEAILHCQRAHGRIPSGTKLIVTQGEYSLWAMTRQRSVTAWRGWLLPLVGTGNGWISEIWSPSATDLPVLATVHLAAIFRDPSLALPTRMDWAKVRRYFSGDWPRKVPEIITEPDPQMFISPAAWDSEWDPQTGRVLRFSVATREGRVYVIEWDDWLVSRLRKTIVQRQREERGGAVQRLLETSQAGEAARSPMSPGSGLRSTGPVSGMLLPSQTGQEARRGSLEQDTSVVRSHTRGLRLALGETGWKMRDLPGDGCESVELGNRPLSRHGDSSGAAMQELQLGSGNVSGQLRDPGSGDPVFEVIGQNIIVDLPQFAQVFPEGSVIEVQDEMLAHAVLWSDLPHDLGFLASLFGPINEHKRLFDKNPVLYAGMDAYVQYWVWRALDRELREDPQSQWIYENSVIPLWGPIMEAEQVGLALDQNRVSQAIQHFARVQREVEGQAQAYAGYSLNLGSPEQVSRWLYQVEKVGVKQKKGRKK